MNKSEFLTALAKRLSALPQSDKEERLAFWGEMIDDRIEEGLSEEDAVADIGDIDSIAESVAAQIPLGKLVKEKVKPKRSLRAWEIVLLVLGFPLWFSLTVAAFAVVLALYISIWAIIISFVAVDVSLALCALCGLAFSAVLAFRGSVSAAACLFGTALISAGVFILLLLLTKAMIKGVARLTKKSVSGLKTSLLGKKE